MFLLKDKFDIIIQGGQSNAEGTGVGEVANAFIPNEKICYLYDNISCKKYNMIAR